MKAPGAAVLEGHGMVRLGEDAHKDAVVKHDNVWEGAAGVDSGGKAFRTPAMFLLKDDFRALKYEMES